LSFGFGGGGSGEIRYVISVDDSQAVQKLQSVSQQFQQMPQALDQATASAGKFSQANADMAAELQATDIGAKNAVQSTQSFGSVMKQNIGTVISMATSVVGLVSNYISLQRIQIQINKLETTAQGQQNRMIDLRKKLAVAIRKYGANSQEAFKAQRDLDLVEQKNINTMDQLAIRKEQQIQQEINFGLSVVQTAGTLIQSAGTIKTWTKTTEGATAATNAFRISLNRLKIATVVGSVLVAIEVAAQAIANNWGNIQQKLDEFYNWAVNVAPALKPVIDAIWTIGKALTALFTGDIDALNKMFSKTAEAAPAASDGMDEFAESGKDVAKAAKDAQKELDEMWNRIDQFASAGVKGIVEASQGKKSEKNDFLRRLGIKGDEKGRMKDFMDDVKDGVKELDQVRGKLQTLKGFDILQKLGFKIPKGVIKDMINTLDSDLRDVIKGKNDPFNKLADILKKSKDKSLPAVEKIMLDFFQKNPKLLDALKQIDPELAAAIQAMIDEATITAQTALDGMELEVPESVWDKAFAAPEVHRDFLNGEDVTDKNKKDSEGSWAANMVKGITDALKPLTDALPKTTQLLGDLASKISAAVVQTWNNFSSAVSIIADWLTELIAPQGWAVFMASVDDAIVSTWNAFSSSITTIADWLTELIAPQGWAVFIAGVDDAIVSTWNAFSSTITVIADWLTELIAPKGWGVFLKSVTEAIQSTFSAFSSTITTIADWLTELIAPEGWTTFLDSVKDTIVDTWNKFSSAVSSLANNLKVLFGLTPPGWLKDPITGNIVPPKGPKTEGGTSTQSEKKRGLTDEEIWSKLTLTPRTPQSDAAEILNSNLSSTEKKALLQAVAQKYGYSPPSTSPYGVDELFQTKGPKRYSGNYAPSGHETTNPSDSYSRQWNTARAINDVPAAPEGGANDKFMQLLIGMGGGGQFGGFGGGAGFGDFAAGGGASPFPNMDIFARQIVQITKDLNIFARAIVTVTQDNNLFARTLTQITSNLNLIARAIVQVTSNNNLLARTIVTVTKDNNLLARTTVTVTKDYNLLARATVTVTKDNNQLAKTIVQITKNNNTLAKTTVTVTKDYNQLARATVQMTKNNNTFARTISQIEKNFKSAADAAKKYASALKSIPSGGGGGGGFSGFDGGGFGFASGGDFITNGPQMITVGESGRERVTITPLGANSTGSGGGATVNQTISLNISGSDLINQRNLTKRIKLTVGENRDKFG